MRFIIYRTGGIYPYAWYLEGKSRNVCKSMEPFSTVEAARSDIAGVKRMMSGAKFAKVEEGPPHHW
jgi:hypothetical protein